MGEGRPEHGRAPEPEGLRRLPCLGSFAVARAREPEIGDPNPPVSSDEDVVRLEVAMNQPRGVSVIEAATGAQEHRDDLAPRAGLRGGPVSKGPPSTSSIAI